MKNNYHICLSLYVSKLQDGESGRRSRIRKSKCEHAQWRRTRNDIRYVQVETKYTTDFHSCIPEALNPQVLNNNY